MIVAITATAARSVQYGVSWGDGMERPHFAIELKLIAVAEDDFIGEFPQ